MSSLISLLKISGQDKDLWKLTQLRDLLEYIQITIEQIIFCVPERSEDHKLLLNQTKKNIDLVKKYSSLLKK